MKTNQARMWLLAWISGTNLSNTFNLLDKCMIAYSQPLPILIPQSQSPSHPLNTVVKSQVHPENSTWTGSNTGCAEWKQNKRETPLAASCLVISFKPNRISPTSTLPLSSSLNLLLASSHISSIALPLISPKSKR